jgi:hypothetical protein
MLRASTSSASGQNVGLAFVSVSGVIPSTAGYVVIVGVCVFLGYVLRTFVGDPSGLKHHHQ